jgi:hypothetical protein
MRSSKKSTKSTLKTEAKNQKRFASQDTKITFDIKPQAYELYDKNEAIL